MTVPQDWELVFETKKRGSKTQGTGYFGFRDSHMKRLEISYAQIRKKAPDLDAVLKDYFKSLKNTFLHLKCQANYKWKEKNGCKT